MPRFGDQARKKKDLERKERAAQARAEKKNAEETARLDKNYSNWSEKRKSNKQAKEKINSIFEKKRGLAGVEAFKKNFAANKEIKHQLDIQEAEKQPEIVPEPETVSFVPEPEIVSRSFRRTLNKHKSLAQRLREVNRDINSIK